MFSDKAGYGSGDFTRVRQSIIGLLDGFSGPRALEVRKVG